MAPLSPALLATYTGNLLRVVDLDDRTTVWRVVPSTAGRGRRRPPVHLLSAANPDGRPTALGENVARREALEHDVLAAGGKFTVGAAHDRDYVWAEEVLAVRGLTDGHAAELAVRHGQPALWRWDGRELTVLDAAGGAELARTPTRAAVLTRRPCVRPRQQPRPDQVCVRPGGPWVRRSMEVAAIWSRDRHDLLAVLGCDVCHAGPPVGQGQPLLLHRWSAASRYGEPAILGESDAWAPDCAQPSRPVGGP